LLSPVQLCAPGGGDQFTVTHAPDQLVAIVQAQLFAQCSRDDGPAMGQVGCGMHGKSMEIFANWHCLLPPIEFARSPPMAF
jgi:hypothetical protein